MILDCLINKRSLLRCCFKNRGNAMDKQGRKCKYCDKPAQRKYEKGKPHGWNLTCGSKECINQRCSHPDHRYSRVNYGKSNGKYRPIGSKILHSVGNGNKYVKIKVAEKKWLYEHRHVMQLKLGIDLKKHEHIHHINENTLDNRIENLRLVTPDEHRALHILNAKWSKKFDNCISCGTIKIKHSCHGLCLNCRAAKSRKDNPEKHAIYRKRHRLNYILKKNNDSKNKGI